MEIPVRSHVASIVEEVSVIEKMVHAYMDVLMGTQDNDVLKVRINFDRFKLACTKLQVERTMTVTTALVLVIGYG